MFFFSVRGKFSLKNSYTTKNAPLCSVEFEQQKVREMAEILRNENIELHNESRGIVI